MSELILHHYDASPFTQRVLRMLGIKGLAWRSVTTPMLPPKDDLLALTGGYRGTPVLQIGADIYIDSQRIARELEARYPTPTLFPDGNAGLAYAAVKWADAFFRAGLQLAIGATSAQWPAEFRQDRQGIFPDVDFDRRRRRACAVATAGPRRLHRAATRRRSRVPGWRGARPARRARLDRAVVHARLGAGRERAAGALARGCASGRRGSPRWARARAASAVPQRPSPWRVRPRPAPCACVEDGAQSLRAGMRVEVTPDDTRRGAVQGTLVALDWNEIGVSRTHAQCGSVVVHFPRLGYRVTGLD